jgi:protein-disulfide isomerase
MAALYDAMSGDIMLPVPTKNRSNKRVHSVRKKPVNKEEVFSIRVKKHQIYAALIPVAFLVGLAMGYYVYGQAAAIASGRGSVETTLEPTQSSDGVQRVDIPIEGNDPVLGAEDAPITIIEFADFQCPYCEKHFLQTYPQLIENYGESIRYVYKDFPLTGIHPQALPAALAAQCALEQGKFWEYHDLLFSGRMDLGEEAYMAYADELGLDTTTFTSCYQEARYNDVVRADYNLGVENGVNATPTFFVNGIRLIGAQPYSVFADLIESELSGQNN